MSSYTVEDKTINRIITFLFWKANKTPYYLDNYLRDEMGASDNKSFQELGRKLLALNIRATEQRYPESPYLNKKERAKRIKNYKFKDEKCSDLQVIKSLHCLRYQCGEGTIPRTKLYKQITNLINRMEGIIIDQMPEYEKAEWG